ncbi:thyroid peroxidase-like isoform X2 [Mizuhopecten yessoensis]|uniref:thyroid peroxidase-like isoform X2 n=1 Tax=Mizuhopecten yessoensis TaxID=6573 RepID=UPI000B45C6E9|nr:thyroid peroxidase-like isoform X2 [Mizuhopecten yessoensis]
MLMYFWMCTLWKWFLLASLLQRVVHANITAIFSEAREFGKQQLKEQIQTRLDRADDDKDETEGSCRQAVYAMKPQTPSGQEDEYDAVEQLETLRYLLERSEKSLSAIRADSEINSLWSQAFPSCLCSVTCPSSETQYRTADGTCNNLANPCWGKSSSPQARLLPSKYGDDLGLGSAPRNATSGQTPVELPSARRISSALFRDFSKKDEDTKLSFEVMSWGQFIDHDMVFTPVSKGAGGNSIACCVAPVNSTIRAAVTDRVECAAIAVDFTTDPHFNNTECLDFVRSAPTTSTDSSCIPLGREQMNLATSFIDGSMVYGATAARQLSLRDTEKNKGDGRTQVVPNLANDHVLILRLHNLFANQLAQRTSWTDEKLFQEARKMTIAVLQQITYAEYLPLILGPNLMNEYKLKVWESSHNIYNSAINPTVFNNFAVAAFRFGHSQITDFQNNLNNYYNHTTVNKIEDTFLRPIFTVRNKGEDLDKHARWKVTSHSGEAGRLFPKGVLDLLFLDSLGHSLDLPAINIQRGRDHGIPPYVEFRGVCGLNVPASFSDLTNHASANRALLASIYGDVADIDLFAGAMTEEYVPGGKVGPTFGCLLGIQFQALKHGDRFWFESSNVFNTDQIIELKKMTLSKVMCLNYNMCNLQLRAFEIPNFINNRPTACSNMPDMNYDVFK